MTEYSLTNKQDSETILNINNINMNDINNRIPISLGWNCTPAIFRANNLNYKKNNGYLTCPFDLAVTPYLGLCQCILDDFDRNKFFNLRVEYDPINKQECILNEYNMWFNHESEQKLNDDTILWYPGKYSEHNYKLFKERYENRIQNFFNYINSNSLILFIFENPHDEPEYLIKILKYKYPNLNFKILLSNHYNEIFYKQYLHSPDFPEKLYDYNYSYKITRQLENLIKYKDANETKIFNNILMRHYRAVILVLASNNNEIYKNCRKIWKCYMNIDPTIKVYFVYGQLSEELTDYDSETDIIFNDIPECYPVLIKKTIEAMKFIDAKVTYDYFIRTNLSTFWNFKNLHIHLDELPKNNCYSGDGPLKLGNTDLYYLSGTDTIVTSEMIKAIINNNHIIDYNLVEDAAMGLFFHYALGAPLLPNRICFFEDINSIKENEIVDNRIITAINNKKDHYRVKTLNNNREEIDLFIYYRLLYLIYNMVL